MKRGLVGAAIGMLVGLGFCFVLIGVPTIRSGDTYEVIDSVVYMGIPLTVLCTVIGTVVGAALAVSRSKHR
jgi:uncharacterized membrane protein YqgA involved in biofilm formation